ncbi:MAG TPA: site-specific integrase, partial [Anaerolineales bacterium]
PATGVIRPKVVVREMQTWTPQQAVQFLAAAKADRLYGLYAVLLGTGMRIGEALGLSWSDWDPQRGTLTIRRQLTEVSGQLSFGEPKTERGKRTVRLPGFAAAAMQEHRTRMQAEGHEMNDRLLIFVDTEGHPIRRGNLRRRSFARVLKWAGLPPCRLHDLRHACASLHLRRGTSPVVVQQMLGHARVSITLDRYSHALPILQEEAAAGLDELLTSVPTPAR